MAIRDVIRSDQSLEKSIFGLGKRNRPPSTPPGQQRQFITKRDALAAASRPTGGRAGAAAESTPKTGGTGKLKSVKPLDVRPDPQHGPDAYSLHHPASRAHIGHIRHYSAASGYFATMQRSDHVGSSLPALGPFKTAADAHKGASDWWHRQGGAKKWEAANRGRSEEEYED